MEEWGFWSQLHDRDAKLACRFVSLSKQGEITMLPLPARKLHASAERWVGSVKEECLSKSIWLGAGSLRRGAAHLGSSSPRGEEPAQARTT
jgi:putative transposase